jgi:hypothetical protein
MDVLAFPSCRVFAFRLALSDELTAFGIAVNYLCILAIVFCHLVHSFLVGLSPTWPNGEWGCPLVAVFTPRPEGLPALPLESEILPELLELDLGDTSDVI